MLRKIKANSDWVLASQKIYPKSNTMSEDAISNFIHANNDRWIDLVESAYSNRNNSLKIVLASSMSDYSHGASFDRRLAIALTELGHRVSFLLCDANLQACQIIKFDSVMPFELNSHITTPRCGRCAPLVQIKFAKLNLPIHNFNF